MEKFKIGDEVFVKAIIKPNYVDERRIWKRHKCNREAFYVGVAYKQEGMAAWNRSRGSHITDIKAIKVIRVKFNERANDKFALAQDVRRIRK